MSDVVLRIQSSVAQGVAGVRAFKDEMRATQIAAADLRSTWRATTAEIVADAKKQIEAERAKIQVYKDQIAAQREVTASYKRGSEERQISTRMEIDLQRRLQAALGETAAVAARGAGAGKARAEESGLLRGAASRSGVAGTGMAALAGPGFIAGAVIGGTLDYAVKAAIEEQKAQANLQNALRDTGNARAATRRQTEEYVRAEERLTGFTRGQVTQTLSQLIRSTGDLTLARKQEALMADIARARQTDLSGAMMLVLKASMGNVGALRRLGIDVQKVTVNQDALKAAHLSSNIALSRHAKELDLAATKTEVMRAVTQKFAGDSAAYMHTFAGRAAELHNQIHDLFVEIGTKAIPTLSTFFVWMQKEIEAARRSHTVHRILHDTVVIIKTAWEGLSVIVRTFIDLMHNRLIRTLTLVAGAMWALDAAVTANPWMVVAAAAILAVGEIHKHWSGIVDFMKNLWNSVIGTVVGALNAIIDAYNQVAGWLTGNIPKLSSTFGQAGTAAGDAFGKQMVSAFMPYANALAALTPGSTGAAGGNAGAKAQAGGTAFGLVTKAKQLGVGSGGIYAKAGGHSGIAKPGSVFDCSGYTYQVYTQNGFKGFPGTSETQWSQDSGPNWTSDHINAADARPGDLVFMVGSEYVSPGHVGIVTDGSGLSARVMQYYRTGQPANTIALGSISDLVGIKRFYLVVKDARGGSKPKPKPTPTVSADFAKQVAAASAAAAAAKTAKAGLKAPSLVGLQGKITAELAAVPTVLDPIEREAIAHIKALQASLHVGMSQTELAKDKVELAKWGKVLKDEIRHNANEAKKAAAAAKKDFQAAAREVAKAWQDGWAAATSGIGRAVTESWAAVQQTFDRETQARLLSMQRDAAAGIQKLQRAFQAQMVAFDRETQAGLGKLVNAQTPEEKAYNDFVAKRAADAAAQTSATQQSDLAAAIAVGDTVKAKQIQDAINQTLLDNQEAALKDVADASRVAADKKTAADQQAYQDARDALKQALSDDEAVREQAQQDKYDHDQQVYANDRAAQWQHLNDMHDDQVAQFDADLKIWNGWLTTKAKSWADFLAFLQGNPVSKGFDGSRITDPAIGASNVSITATAAALRKQGDSAIANFLLKQIPAHAAGGIHMRPTVGMLGDQGPEATLPLTGPRGQAVVAQLARAIAAAGGAGGGGTTIYGTFLGATERQVGRALEGLVTPQQARVVRYKAPL